MLKRHREILISDPWYSPHLSLDHLDFSIDLKKDR